MLQIIKKRSRFCVFHLGKQYKFSTVEEAEDFIYRLSYKDLLEIPIVDQALKESVEWSNE